MKNFFKLFSLIALVVFLLPNVASAAMPKLLPVPGSSCDMLSGTDKEKCRKSICPRICQKNTAPYVCTNDDEYKHYYCNHGVCIFEEKNILLGNPKLTAPGALPCNYTMEDFIQVGINMSNLIFGIAGGLMLLFIVYGGFKFVISQGNAEGIDAAKKTLTAAFIGVIIIIGATVIVRFVGSLIGGSFSGETNLGRTGLCVPGNSCPAGTVDGPRNIGNKTCIAGQSYCIPK